MITKIFLNYLKVTLLWLSFFMAGCSFWSCKAKTHTQFPLKWQDAAGQPGWSVYAPHLKQSVRLQLFIYRGSDNAHGISMNKMAATAVQWELCGEFRIIMGIMTELLGVVCKAPSGAGRYIRVLTASFVLLPQLLDEQTPAARSLPLK